MLESVAAGLLNRFLKTYVDNLNTSQLNIGIWSGDVRLKNLKLKKEALDKFRLPVHVKEGYLGDLTLNIPWNNLKGKPVRVLIENVYLLASPADPDAQYDAQEEERRAYAAKMEKLESAELLTTKPSAGMSAEDEAKNESFMASLTNRIVDNLQLTVKNVHLRYEDDVSVPGHPFSIGITLGGFTAVSTDKFWQPTFIHNSAEGIHKIANLDSLSVYFDSESKSLAGHPTDRAIVEFNALIAKAGKDAKPVEHQYILAPVSGEGRLIMNHHVNATTPKTDAELLFKELAFTIDEDQYRDALSLVDLMHFYTRKHQYRKYKPSNKLIQDNRYKALWRFAQDSILHEVQEKHRRWTWDYFKERRDDRRLYVYVFKLNARGEITPDDKSKLDELEHKLSYQDIRFYRSIARSELRKERANARQTEQQKKLQQGSAGKGTSGTASNSGWLSWVWGSNKTQAHAEDEQPQDLLSDEQRKELYDAIDWDEKDAVASSMDVPKDALKLRLKAKLDTGSFALRRDPHSRNFDMIKITFDRFSADVLQRPDNLEAEMALGGMAVFDGTLENSLHKQIVKVKAADESREDGGYLVAPDERGTKEARGAHGSSGDRLDKLGQEAGVAGEEEDPFFYVKFEQNPLDERADTGLTVRMRYMEIVYHKGYVEDIVRFFKPPASQLESVNALVDAASSTLEGIRKETRAGLEFALQQHKTVDLRVDMNAPIIIIPEDVTKSDCQHIVLDAGYISINSELVDKDAVAEIRAKENQQYSDADFERLESLVYDRYHIKLQSAQLLMANTLEECMNALKSESSPQIHILDRINMGFKAETCIVAKAPNLTRFRVLGDLPDLHIHFSDRKYKRLMRMIDVVIPKFDGGDVEEVPATNGVSASADSKSTHTQATYRQAQLYVDTDDALSLGEHTDTEDDDEDVGSPKPRPKRLSQAPATPGRDKDDGEDTFYDPGDIVEGNSNFRQKSFEFRFTVSKLQASIYKSDLSLDKPDKLLADAILNKFDFAFALRPYDMQVDIALGSFTIDDKMVDQSSRFQQLVTSDLDHAGKHGTTDLVRIRYARVQPDSPEFMTVHEGNNQSVDVELSTISLIVTRASILMLFDWIMTTFTGGNDAEPHTNGSTAQSDVPMDESTTTPLDPNERTEKLRVKVKLTEVRLVLNDDGARLATLSLQAADVSVLLRGPFMRVAAQLGNLSLTDDYQSDNLQEYKMLLSIEGDNLADFSYEKYDASEATYPGYDSQVFLRTGSFRLVFVEDPIHRILRFLTKFARMKAVYDAATSAAAQSASEIQQQANKMRYDILAKTPIILLPRTGQSTDAIVANLGEMSVKNSFSSDKDLSLTHIEASLRKIRLASLSGTGQAASEVQMLKDVDFGFDITMVENADREGGGSDRPDTEIVGKMSDVKMHLTAHQYAFLIDLSKTVPRAFATSEEEAAEDEDMDAKVSAAATPTRADSPKAIDFEQTKQPSETVDLFPELAKVATDERGHKITLYSKLEFAFSVGTVYLELFTDQAVSKETLKVNSLARFSLNETDVKYKMVSNGSAEAEVLLRSFTVHDTRPEKETKFREIIPASKEKGYQLMVSYTMSGGPDRSAVANVTVDTPSIIFSLDPLFAMLDFAKYPFKDAAPVQTDAEYSTTQQAANDVDVESSSTQGQGQLAFRVNIVQASVKLLADPSRHDSEAIVLSIRQIQMAQQGTFVLSVDRLGIFLCRMDRPKEIIRILDDFDLNLSMDARSDDGSQSSNIELDVQPLVLRLSNRDIVLVNSIVNRAIELSGSNKGDQASHQETKAVVVRKQSEARASTSGGSISRRRSSAAVKQPRAEVLVTKESLRAVFGGLRLVLISDLHELPVLDFKTPRFAAKVEDWSGDMRAGVTLTPVLNYYNLTNSRWEALIDPWEFSVQASKNAATQALSVTLSSKRRLEVNVTHTFIELAMNTTTLWSQKGEEVLRTSRGSNAPFLMCNRTGHPLVIWAESDDRNSKPEPSRIADGEDLPWRMDDWRTMRESATSNLVHNSIGIFLEGTPWERVKRISVEREGEQVYRLKPRLDKITHRILCDIKLVNNVKVVTLRSTFKVQNLTLVPSEMVLVDEHGKKASAVFKLPPGAEFCVPIEAAYHQRIKFRPDPGFNHAWSSDSYHWQDFVKRPGRTITCRSLEKEASFRFQAFADFDKDDGLVRSYPRLTLRLRAPVEIENLLPFDIRFRVYDKNREHNWSSFLRKGGTSPLHMAELSHLLLLSVEIQDSPFKRSEFAIINTDNPDDLPIEHHTPVVDNNDIKMNLQLFYVRHPASGGAFKVQIYSPYVVYNKTGLDFALKSKAPFSSPKNVAGLEIFSKEHRRTDVTPFLFNYGSRDARNRVLLRLADSAWSEILSFETIGTDTEVVISSQSGAEEIHAGMSVTEGLGDYKIIKVITFYPRFVLKNTVKKAMRVRPSGATYTLTLQPDERQPLHWLRKGAPPQVSLSYAPFGQWTPTFDLSEVGETHLKLQEENGGESLLRADVAINGAIVFVTLNVEERGYPILVENGSDFSFALSQAIASEPGRRAPEKKYSLDAHSNMPFAWDDPMQQEKIIRLSAGSQEREIKVLEIGAQMPFKFAKNGQGAKTVSIDVLAEGHTQVVKITNYDESHSMFKLHRRETSMSMTRSNSQTSSNQELEFEAKDQKTPVTFSLNLSLEGIGISLINRNMVELLYATFRGIRLTYSDSATSQSVHFVIKWIQIDNQLFGSVYKILLYPSVIPKDAKELEVRPNLDIAATLLKDQGHGVMYFQFASLLLQRMTIEVDEDFLFSLLDFTKFEGVAGSGQEVENCLTLEGDDLPEAPQAQPSTEVFFELLRLQPVQLDLSFMRTETMNSESALFSSNRNAVAYFLNAITMTIGNVNDSPIRLNALLIENVRLSYAVLSQRIALHYQQEFLSQLYRVLGSADFLGNPIGLFSNVSSGVADLFYEPTDNVVEFRDFGTGLARGAGSFLKKTVFGVTDSMTKVTGSIGKGLSAATLDKQFQSQRRQRQVRNKPRHALYGVAAGAGSLVTSVASGFEGLARLPIEGAESSGAGGFFKGVGKGLVGVATKPAVGLFDFASNVTEGIRNTTTVFDQKAIDAVRLPRLIPHDKVLRTYNEREALGQFWLKNLENSRYKDEHYVAHLPIPGEKEEDLMVIVTTSAIILARVTKLKVMWHVPLRDLQSITLEPNGISLILREGARGPFLALPDQESRLWLFGHIERVVNSHNSERRVE